MPGAYTFPVDPRGSCFEELAEDVHPFACENYGDGMSESISSIGEHISFLIGIWTNISIPSRAGSRGRMWSEVSMLSFRSEGT
jgi:hypothetical protein